MGKVVGTIAKVVGLIGLTIVTAGAALGVAAGFSAAAGIAAIGAGIGVSASTLFMVSAGLSIASSLLASRPKAPSVSSSVEDRLHANIDPRTPRKIVFGSTAMATDIRDQELTNDQTYLHRFIVVAAHKVGAIREIWFDDKLAWTAADGAQGGFNGYLLVATRLEGAAANAINISARMGLSRRYTGLAYVHLRYRLTGNGNKAESPFAQAIPSRVTIVGDGALIYDPRLDSTVGGSGPQRANNQATWTWNASACRNPALQLLWFLLGWRIQNPVTGAWKLDVGKGIPPERIDIASFITAANLCDEPVAKASGGTEPRYRSDGIFSEGDDPTLVLDNLKATMNAELDDVDGKIRLTVLHNDLGTPVADFNEDDVLGDFTWDQTPPLSDTFNIIRGGYTDASNNSLYQLIDYPEVAVASPDGIDRVEQINLPMVQSASQAQRLVKQRLQRMFYSGVFGATFQVTGWKVQKGDPVRLTFPALGWSNKLLRVVDHETRHDGTVPMVLRVEHANIYAHDATDAAPVLAADPTTYDNLKNPMVQAIIEAGTGAVTARLTNEAHTVPATNGGVVTSYAGASGSFEVTQGTQDISEQFALSTAPGGNPQGLTVAYTGRTFAVTGGLDASEDNATLTVRASGTGAYAGLVREAVFSLGKSKDGADGTPAVLVTLNASASTFKFDASNNPVAQTVTFTATRQNTTVGTFWTVLDKNGASVYGPTSAATLAATGFFSSTGNDNLSMSHTQFAARLAGGAQYETLTIIAAAGGQSDRVSITKVKDGATGASGAGVVTLVNKANVTIEGGKVTKTGGGTLQWDGSAHSLEGYSGNVQAAARIPDTSKHIMVGLNSDPDTDAIFTSIDMAAYADGGIFRVFLNGADYGSFGTAANGDFIFVRRRGSNAEFGVLGQPPRLVLSLAAINAFAGLALTETTKLHFDSSLYEAGAVMDACSLLPIGNDGLNGTNGIPGPPGANGQATYVHFAYADSADGSVNFTTGAANGRYYIGTYTDFVEADSGNNAVYTWSRFRGADGTNGIPGTPGSDGQTPYVHIAYANSANGTSDFHLSDPVGRTYIGVYTDYTLADSANPTAYTWSLIKGTDGINFSVSPASVTVQATFAGVTKAGEMNKNVSVAITQGSTNVTSSATISLTISDPANITATYANGTVVISKADVEGYVEVNATLGGVALQAQKIPITRQRDSAPPASETSQAKQFDTAIMSSQTSYGGPRSTASIVMTANASGIINGELATTYYASAGYSSPITLTIAAKLGFRLLGSGAAFADFGAEVVGSQSRTPLIAVGEPGDTIPGSISLSQQRTGLTAGAQYEIVAYLRRAGGNDPATQGLSVNFSAKHP